MRELWSGVGEHPILEGLDSATAAEVLLRAGALTGWIGSAKQIEGAQEAAKNLISASLTIFESAQDTLKAAEAQSELALCYWREGAFNEARVVLGEAISKLSDKDSDLKAVALLRRAIVERTAKRFNDAFHTLSEAASLFEAKS